ncbi:MAG: hypothetical protein GY801_10090 [bacterium]|nr:hypothetical protein [bacterium]
MENHILKKLILCVMLLSVSVFMSSCSKDDDGNPRDGLLDNQTPYNIRVNFMGIKISEVPSEEMVRENALDSGTTYQVQVSIVDANGVVIEVLPFYSLYVDRSADDNRINEKTCSWYLSVVGQASPFSMTSGS